MQDGKNSLCDLPLNLGNRNRRRIGWRVKVVSTMPRKRGTIIFQRETKLDALNIVMRLIERGFKEICITIDGSYYTIKARP